MKFRFFPFVLRQVLRYSYSKKQNKLQQQTAVVVVVVRSIHTYNHLKNNYASIHVKLFSSIMEIGSLSSGSSLDTSLWSSKRC